MQITALGFDDCRMVVTSVTKEEDTSAVFCPDTWSSSSLLRNISTYMTWYDTIWYDMIFIFIAIDFPPSGSGR